MLFKCIYIMHFILDRIFYINFVCEIIVKFEILQLCQRFLYSLVQSDDGYNLAETCRC